MRIETKKSIVDVDIVHDGARNTLFDITGEIEEDLSPMRVIDIKNLYHEPGYDITKLRIDWVQYYIGDGILVELLWEGSGDTSKQILPMSGKGKSEHEKAGGKQNNQFEPTGNIMLKTSGFTGKRKTFSIEIETIKQFT